MVQEGAKHDQTPILGPWSCSTVREGAEHAQTGVWSCLNGAGWRRACADTNCWCLIILEWYRNSQSMTRHQQLVSDRARTVQDGAEHAQTPAIGVWLCSNGAGSRRPRPDTSNWCLIVLERCRMVQSTARHQQLVSGRARTAQEVADHDQTPASGV